MYFLPIAHFQLEEPCSQNLEVHWNGDIMQSYYSLTGKNGVLICMLWNCSTLVDRYSGFHSNLL